MILCAAALALHFGRVVDGHGGVIKDAFVVVDGERIKSVGHDVPKGAQVVDLTKYTALPGLIDVHTHMTYYWDRTSGTRPWAQLGTLHDAVTVYLGQENARKALESGVTTVRDLGSYNYLDIAMRDLINRGAMVGPRMFVAGYGLHVSNAPSKFGVRDPNSDLGKADGVAEVQRVAREQIAAGVDWIKMYGSTGSDQDVSGFETYSFEEMKAAVDVAHRAGKKIAIHSYGPDGARDALHAGADSIEHATDMDAATIAELAKSATVYVPTVDHNRYYAAHKDEFGYGDEVVKHLNDYIARNFETLKHAVAAHVKIAMGSDAVFTGFGENARELDWFVKAGMTPAEALSAATTTPAALLGKEKERGAIGPGYYADIIAVEGDPLADISVLTKGNLPWVMKGGHVVVERK
jgi:imidazolonepropionase-like amidohydrolase